MRNYRGEIDLALAGGILDCVHFTFYDQNSPRDLIPLFIAL